MNFMPLIIAYRRLQSYTGMHLLMSVNASLMVRKRIYFDRICMRTVEEYTGRFNLTWQDTFILNYFLL